MGAEIANGLQYPLEPPMITKVFNVGDAMSERNPPHVQHFRTRFLRESEAIE